MHLRVVNHLANLHGRGEVVIQMTVDLYDLAAYNLRTLGSLRDGRPQLGSERSQIGDLGLNPQKLKRFWYKAHIIFYVF